MTQQLYDRLPDRIQKQLTFILGDIAPRHSHESGYSRGGGRSFLVRPPTGIAVPELVRFVLVAVWGCSDLGIHEKRAWEIPVTYRGVDIGISLEKFGLRIYVDADAVEDADAAQELATSLWSQIAKAVPSIEKHVLKDLVDRQVREGRVTLANPGPQLWQRYEHFRRRSREHVEAPPTSLARIVDGLSRETEFDAVAAVTAYLSFLEHLCVVAMAFTTFDPQVEPLQKVARASWRDLFKRVTDINHDPEAKRHYDALTRIADEHRNPWVHGGFDDGQLYFHLPGYSAVPIRLSDHGRGPTYEFAVVDDSADSVWTILDAVTTWLQTGPLRHALALAMSGLDIPFDPNSRAELQAASSNDDAFEALLEGWATLEDLATNMDW